MEEFPPSPKRYRFGFYEVDTASRELRKRGVRVFLGEKPFELLSALLERPGEVITRKELRRRLWPGVDFLEFDNGLNTAVHRLREALVDSAQQGRYIETLPRVGYRFAGSLDPVVSRSEPAPARETKLTVLPLVNLTGDPAQEYFSDGMTEELITQLAALAPAQLQVIARTSAMRYKATRKSAALIARELHVDYLVEGSVRRTGQRVRISAQLIRASDCMHVWADNYDRELRDILDLQAEVSQAIALQIHLLVHPAGDTQPLRKATLEPEAYDAYINGLYHLNKYNPDSLLKAIDFFSRRGQ